MSRLQLALNVRDVDAAAEFYQRLFGSPPTKRRPGYANFAIDQPPLKLVLIENPEARGDGVTGALNHLGIEVETPTDVAVATGRLSGLGLATTVEAGTTCCYAVQDKVWVNDPDGAPWEVYTVLADVPADAPVAQTLSGDAGCSCTTADAESRPAAAPAATSAGCC